MPHAKLSPSSAHRWMNCSGSVALIGDSPNNAGEAAMLGTAAHKVIEQMLQRGASDASEYHGFIIHVKKDGDEETAIYAPDDPAAIGTTKPGWFAFVCDDAMVAGVQMMIDEVARVKEELFDAELFTERYLDGSWLDPRLGGTADVTLVEPAAWIHLFDYKNGRVIVEVTNNEQMKNYGVFLLHEHPNALGVVVHLIQPNALHEDGCIREETYTADELKLFELSIKAAADATSVPNAPLRAGDWCIYCPGKDRCPAFETLMLEEAGVDFANDPVEPIAVPTLTTEFVDPAEWPQHYIEGDEYRSALARRARWIPLMDQAARDIRAKIQAELLNGKEVGEGDNGWKLVRGKSNRAYIDEVAAQERFNESGIGDEHLFTNPKLKSPAQIEKLGKTTGIKPKKLKEIVAEVTFKPEGRISIAPMTDARDAIDPTAVAVDEFASDPAEDFEP